MITDCFFKYEKNGTSDNRVKIKVVLLHSACNWKVDDRIIHGFRKQANSM